MSASVFYDKPREAISWLCSAFGFEVRMLVDGLGDDILHSELVLAEALIMVSGTNGSEPWQQSYKSPERAGGVTQALAFHIDDVDAHHARAVQVGARVIREPLTNDYGADYWSDRSYGALDPEGHLWWFMQRMRG